MEARARTLDVTDARACIPVSEELSAALHDLRCRLKLEEDERARAEAEKQKEKLRLLNESKTKTASASAFGVSEVTVTCYSSADETKTASDDCDSGISGTMSGREVSSDAAEDSTSSAAHILEPSGEKPVWTVTQRARKRGDFLATTAAASTGAGIEERNRTTYADGTTVINFCNDAVVILEVDGGAWCWAQVCL